MNSSIRSVCLPVAACLALAVRLPGADTPAASKPAAAATSATATPAPAAALPPRPQPPAPMLPRSLEGVVTQDEFTTYVRFQQGLREDPEIKALNVQIRGKMNEMLELQKKVQMAQQKAVEANPEIKAIADKIAKSRQRPPPPPPGNAHPAPAPAAAAAAPTATPK